MTDEITEEVKPISEKKLHKKQVKAEQKEKRKLKKELKMAFKTQDHKNAINDITEVGGIKAGVSVKKIY